MTTAETSTIPGLLRRNATESADLPALTSGIGPDASTLTWSQLRAEIAALTHGLRALGLSTGDRMLIMMSKRPEHWIVDLAAAHLGVLSCTAYDTLSSVEISYIARHSAARVVVLEGADQLERWLPVLEELPALRRIVVVERDAIPDDDARFVSYQAVRAAGRTQHLADEPVFERLTDAVAAEAPLCMIYTSGTTGNPKGVVLSHRNVVSQATALDGLAPTVESPRSVSYLPLAHIAERALGIYLPTYHAGHVTICADPLQLLATMAAVHPYTFFGVPRVWEKMAAGLSAKLSALPEEQRAGVTKANEIARQVFHLRAAGKEIPAELRAPRAAVDERVLGPIRTMLGLDQSVLNFSGAAPIPDAVVDFLAGFGIDVLEVWGLSETTGAATVSVPDAFSVGGVGKAIPGVEVRLADDGEILVRGPIVFLGYLQADGTIAPDTDADGWLATGDIGTIDDAGIVSITDRKKELIITSGGKNIAPSTVEQLLRAHPLIAQAVAIGDRRPYVTALLVLDEESAPAWAKARGLDTLELAELAEHPDVVAELEAAVATANESLARVEQVKRHHVLGTPWTAESGELTPTLKLRRRVIVDRYATEIEQLYAEAPQPAGASNP